MEKTKTLLRTWFPNVWELNSKPYYPIIISTTDMTLITVSWYIICQTFPIKIMFVCCLRPKKNKIPWFVALGDD